MKKIVISGGPSTGKSTVFEILKTVFPTAYFVDEAAEKVIREELAKQSSDPTYVPKIPATNYREFQPLLLSQQLADEANIPSKKELVFMDRCLIDNLGYLAYNGLNQFIPEVKRQVQIAGYTIVFFCDPLTVFEQTNIRHETPEQGLVIHQSLEDAYHEAGIQIVHLPAISAEDRVTVIRDTLQI